MNEGISEELDGLKTIFQNMESLLDSYAKEVLNMLPKDSRIKSLALTFLPQLGKHLYTKDIILSFPRSMLRPRSQLVS